jgi:hypothetical protein
MVEAGFIDESVVGEANARLCILPWNASAAEAEKKMAHRITTLKLVKPRIPSSVRSFSKCKFVTQK